MGEVQRALQQAIEGGSLTTTNRAFQGAWQRGYRDYLVGLIHCPYPDRRGHRRNIITFSRSFRKYWFDGFEAARKRAKEAR